MYKTAQPPVYKTVPERTPRRKDAAEEKKILAYFSDWTTRDMPAASIPFDKITHINYGRLRRWSWRPTR